MYEDKTLGVVIPAYNEERLIADIVTNDSYVTVISGGLESIRFIASK